MILKALRAEKHTHVALIGLNGMGLTSVDANHFHPIVDGKAQPYNNHTHELAPLPDTTPKPDENKYRDEAYDLYKTAAEWEYPSRIAAQESEEFVRGAQWEEGDQHHLKNLNRAALTINITEAMVDFLVGTHMQNPTDWRWKPVEGSDNAVADLLNTVTKHVANRTNFTTEDQAVFKDLVVAGRGFFNVYMDYNENPKGKIKIERMRWDGVYVSPHDREDGSDIDYIIKAKWYTPAQIKSMFPDKAEEISDIFVDRDPSAGEVDMLKDHYEAILADKTLVDVAKKQIKLLEVWRKEYIDVPVIVYNNEVESDPNLTKADARRLKTISQVKVIERKTHRLHVTKLAGSVVLDQYYVETPDNDFDIIPVYAKKQGKYWWGKVEAGKDPQREVNKARSCLVDILNKTANYGYWFDSNTFPDEKAKQNALHNVTQPGFMLEVADVSKPPRKEEGAKFPTEIANLDQMMIQTFRLVTNVNPEAMGQGPSSQSGIAMNRKLQQTLVGNEFLFNALALAKARLGRKVAALIQQEYSPERIYRITQQEGEELDPSIITLFKTADLLEYDVECGEGPSSPTARQANAMVLLEMARAGMPIPPEVIISYMDFPEKEKVLADMQQQKQQAMEMERSKQQTEIVKTQIANQDKQPNPRLTPEQQMQMQQQMQQI